jgi:hypothetical protein
MTPLTIQAMQWTLVRDLHETAPLDAGDLRCMVELREVLARHGRLGRFALHLVHKHFDIEHTEVLVEYSDPARREQWLRVEPRASEILRQAVPTTWTLEQRDPLVACVCAFRAEHGHLGRHESR